MQIRRDIESKNGKIFYAVCKAISESKIQEEKNAYFQKINDSRKNFHYKACDYDDMGLNLLHWAVICNQEELVAELIEEKSTAEQIDINAGTLQCNGITRKNATPLFLAVLNKNSYLVSLLLAKKADVTIAPESYIVLPKLRGWQRFKDDEPWYVAMRLGDKKTAKLLEQAVVKDYINKRNDDPNEYKTTTSFFGFFHLNWGYSKNEKISAATIFLQKLKSRYCTFSSLNQLKNIHPAIITSELGSIYHTSLEMRAKSKF